MERFLILLTLTLILYNDVIAYEACGPLGGRCRPKDPCWPTPEQWQGLNASVNGRLLIPENIVQPCIVDETTQECRESLEALTKDPFYLQTNPGASQSTGQVNAWKFQPSAYAVEAHNDADIVNAVNFARNFNLRLVVKGTGHDYYGRSSAPDSLLVWTHSMRDMAFHDGFYPAGSNVSYPAVTLEAGLTWMDVYAAASIDRNLYVQGGGCTSVGVVGWHIGGGFGSFSKNFGTGPANMLEAKVVTAQGEIVVASEFQNADLFYALRGGGFGFGVVVSLTVRTHPLPPVMGFTTFSVYSKNRENTTTLVSKLLENYRDNMLGPDWGEQVSVNKIKDDTYSYSMNIGMLSLTTTYESLQAWYTFTKWVSDHPDDYAITAGMGPLGSVIDMPGKFFWDIKNQLPGTGVPTHYDPREPERGFTWAPNIGEISSYWISYVSRFLRYDHFLKDTNSGAELLVDLVDGLGYFGLHFNKAQFGAPEWARQELAKTSQHPSIKDSFALLIGGRNVGHFSPLVSTEAQYNTSNVRDTLDWCQSNTLEDCNLTEYYAALNKFREATPNSGAYFNEADYGEPDWQDTFWGQDNYQRLLKIKNKWDPDELFYCHKCVGSENWKNGGMCRSA